MIAYLDSSTLLRVVLNQKNTLKDWGQWERGLTSELTRIEGLRAIDRLRLEGRTSDTELATCVDRLERIISHLEEIQLNRRILREAARSFPTIIGTLDAVHLASAALWQEGEEDGVIFMTHDIQQGVAAKAIGLRASGFES